MKVFKHFLEFQRALTERIIWPYSIKKDSLYRWRAYILSSILLAGIIFGSFSFIAAALLIVKENVWGLAVVDFSGLVICIIFLFAHRIRFEFRAVVTLLGFYLIGISVIISVGPLSGGTAWLFAFAVLAGVLIGNWAALIAIFMNFISLAIIGYLMTTGMLGDDFPFFKTHQAMIAAGINFIGLNGITAVSVSTLLKILYTSEKRYRLIANNVADVIWTMNRKFEFTYISPSIKKLLGYTVDEMMNKTTNEILTKRSVEKAYKIFGKKLKLAKENNGKAWDPVIFEAEHYCKDGSTVLANIHASLLKGMDNNSEGILGITRDITQRKKNEKEKIRNQMIIEKNRKFVLVGQIAGKMAHDFNNVLGIIMGHSELAMLTCKDLDLNKTFKLIFDQTLRGKNLTKNLIAFAKNSDPKQEFFFLNDKIDFVLNLLKTDLADINVIKEDVDEIEILADPGMIEHAFVNLIQNSIHALSLTKKPEISVRIYASDKKNFIEIKDNGCGIPGKYKKQIYAPSFTLKGSKDEMALYKNGIKGTGYGLANVKKYIELHKGNISIESKLGVGTKFTISIDVTKKELTHKEKIILNNTQNYSNKKILIVEDEKAISEIQQKILTNEPCNHEVDIAYDGIIAIELFKKNKYDMVSLDYILPGKMNGMDVYKYIRKKDASVPILFISGNIEFLESIKNLKQEDTIMDHITKPCQNVEYISQINKLFKFTQEQNF